jgi:hypothetical protein
MVGPWMLGRPLHPTPAPLEVISILMIFLRCMQGTRPSRTFASGGGVATAGPSALGRVQGCATGPAACGVPLIDGLTPVQAFLHAARCGDVEGMDAYVARGGSVDVWDSAGRTATTLAARHRQPEALAWCALHTARLGPPSPCPRPAPSARFMHPWRKRDPRAARGAECSALADAAGVHERLRSVV